MFYYPEPTKRQKRSKTDCMRFLNIQHPLKWIKKQQEQKKLHQSWPKRLAVLFSSQVSYVDPETINKSCRRWSVYFEVFHPIPPLFSSATAWLPLTGGIRGIRDAEDQRARHAHAQVAEHALYRCANKSNNRGNIPRGLLRNFPSRGTEPQDRYTHRFDWRTWCIFSIVRGALNPRRRRSTLELLSNVYMNRRASAYLEIAFREIGKTGPGTNPRRFRETRLLQVLEV